MKVTGAKAYEIDALARRTTTAAREKSASGSAAGSAPQVAGLADDPSRVSISSASRARGAAHAERSAHVDGLRDRVRDGGIKLEPAALAQAMLAVDEG